MKQHKKIIFISSGVILFIGLIIMFCSLLTVGFDVTALDLCGESQEITETYDVNNVNTISVDLGNSDIIIKQSNDEKIRITYYTTDCCPKKISLSEDCELTLCEDSNPFEYNIKQFTKGFFHGINSNSLKTVIEIPANCGDINICIDTSNGEIQAESFCSNDMKLLSSNGAITADNITVSYSLIIDTSNGDIMLSNIDVGDTFDAETSNGMITADNITANLFETATSNGDVSFSNIRIDDSFIIETSNGAITAKNITSDSFTAYTSNGDITFSDIIADTLKTETSNGNIDGTVGGNAADYQISSGTSNGNDSLAVYNNENPSAQKSITAYTTNGDISVTFNGDIS